MGLYALGKRKIEPDVFLFSLLFVVVVIGVIFNIMQIIIKAAMVQCILK